MKSKLTNFLSLAVVMLVLTAVFTVSAFAEISGGFGNIVGLDTQKTYEAAPATINAAGDGLAIGEYTAVSGTTTGLAGLYYVRETGVTENGTLIYVYGKVADRQTIFEGAESDFPTSAEGTAFVLGSIISSRGYELKNASGNCLISYGGIFNTYSDANYNDKTDTDRKEQFDLYSNRLQSAKVMYALTSNEIIPVSEVEKYTWAMSLRYSPVSYTGLVSKFVAYVMLPSGEVKSYEYLHTAANLDAGYSSSEGTRNLYATDKFVKTVDFTQKESDFGTWSAELPDEGYFVGFEIYPTYGMNDFTKLSKGGTTSFIAAGTFSLIVNFSASKYEIDIPTAKGPTGLTVSGKTISGLDESTEYLVGAINVFGFDSANAVPVTGETSYTIPDGKLGVYGIVYAADAYRGVSEVGALVYVRPKFADLSSIYERDSNLQIINETNDALREGFSVGKLTSKNFPQLNATYDNAAAQIATISIFKSGSTASETEKKAAFDSNVDFFKKLAVRYAFLDKEIVPISEVKSYAWGIAAFYSNFKYTGLVSKFVAHVVLPNGEVKAYEYLHAPEDYGIYGKCENTKWNVNATKVVDFTQKTSAKGSWTEELPSEGYLVGFEFYPLYGMTDYSKVETGVGVLKTNIYNATTIHISDVDYVIEQPGYDAPTGITVNEETVSGFGSDYEYVVVPITINGADNSKAVDITPVDGKYVFDAATMPGLWGVAIKGDEYYANSDTSAPFYIKGSADARQKIGTFDSNPDYPVFAKGNGYVIGKIIGAGIDYPIWENHAVSGAYGNLAQYLPGVGSAIDIWGRMYTYEEALAIHKESKTDTKPCNSFLTEIEKFYTDEFKAKDPATVAAELVAIKESVKENVQSLVYYYGYDSDEIIAVDELLNFKVGFGKPQGAVLYTDVMAKLSFAVMNSAGEVNEYSTLVGPFNLVNNGFSKSFDVDVQAIEGLPSEGWIVGFKLQPYAELSLDNITAKAWAPQDERGSAYVFPQTQMSWYFYHGTKDYAIKQDAPTPELSSFPVIGGGFGQISGLNSSYLYEYKYSADGTTYPDSWSDVPANATALNVTDAGYYMVRAKNTADYGKSEVALIRVIEYTGAIDELPYTEPVTKMYLPSDFVELQAEYEIDVTIKNWVASLALENIKALSPESVIKINGEEFKFSVTAADIETDEAVHYYNMDVSLFGESRHNVNLEKFKELAGDAYLTDIYFESSKPLPFKKAELSVYLGAEYDGYDVELNLYNEKINRLRLVETASVYEGWATFTNCAETYVVVLPD